MKPSDSPLSTTQLALVGLLTILFVFCMVRTFTALRAPAHAAPAENPLAIAPPPAPVVQVEAPLAAPAPSIRPAPLPLENRLPGATIIEGPVEADLALSVTATARLAPSPAVKLAVAPTDEPSEEPSSVPPAVAPTPAPTPVPSPSPPPLTVVTIKGTLKGPSPVGVAPLANHPVSLYDFDNLASVNTGTDSHGHYQLTGLKPGGLYYVIALFNESTITGHHFEMRYGPFGSVSTEVPTVDESHISWHEEITADKAGVYVLDLDPTLADPEYCGDLIPTYDPIARTPFTSYRTAALQPAQ